jgi:hypothetical protein
VWGSLPTGFPIRTSAGLEVFAPLRSFSQLVASFFASESHRHPPCALSLLSFFLFTPCKNLVRSILDLSRFLYFITLLHYFSFFLCVSIMSMISFLWWRITDSNR